MINNETMRQVKRLIDEKCQSFRRPQTARGISNNGR